MDEVLSNQTRKILKEMNLTFRKAGISEIDLIMQLYKERAQWFKENNIQQWTKYMEHHPKKEFEEIIKKKNIIF